MFGRGRLVSPNGEGRDPIHSVRRRVDFLREELLLGVTKLAARLIEAIREDTDEGPEHLEA